MKTLLCYCLASITALGAMGCASVGKEFNYAKRSDLVIGKTTMKDAEQMFGSPFKSSTVSNADGEFQVMRYSYAYADITGAKARTLTLEFRNNLLNASIYNSGFSEDSTEFKTEVLPQVNRGSSNKVDVLRIMGEPTGKARCPSSFSDFKSICENSTEVWIWVYTQKSKGLDTKTIKSRFIKVAFNANDVVSNIESSVDN
jgi:hypothetical protein